MFVYEAVVVSGRVLCSSVYTCVEYFDAVVLRRVSANFSKKKCEFRRAMWMSEFVYVRLYFP